MAESSISLVYYEMGCRGTCNRYRAKKTKGGGRYSNGQKRCQICEIFINWEGFWCPCCGYRLRTKPRNLKDKAKLRESAKSATYSPPKVEPQKDSISELQ